MNREDELLKRHLLDLANTAYMRQTAVYSDFLNLWELHIYHKTAEEFPPIRREVFGGYEFAERQMVAFLPDALSFDWEESDAGRGTFPIQCLVVRPRNEKFTETLSHRDYLGAILNLGVDRSKIGDILTEPSCAYVMCQEKMGSFLARELSRVRHTPVMTDICQIDQISYTPRTETVSGTVPSVRLDAVIALAFRVSRSKMTPLIEGGKVFVNGRLITSNAYLLRDQDLVSVRGYGKFRFCAPEGQTRKGRYFTTLERFI